MPIYAYKCKTCGEEFELLIGVTSKKTKLQCKKCKSTKIEKTFAPFGINTIHKNSNQASCNTCNLKSGCPLGKQ